MANPTPTTSIDTAVDVSILGITNSTNHAVIYDYHARADKFIVRWIDSEGSVRYADLKATDITIAS